MAQATRSLSPKRALERMQRHRHAVILLALQRAKRSVQAGIRAKGLRICDFAAKEITLLAEAELERNRAQLIAEAEEAIATWPGFERWRLPVANISSAAQTTEARKSITSAVQIS
jgi:hypothetical protein